MTQSHKNYSKLPLHFPNNLDPCYFHKPSLRFILFFCTLIPTSSFNASTAHLILTSFVVSFQLQSLSLSLVLDQMASMSFTMDSASVLNPKLITHTHLSLPFNKLPHSPKFHFLLKPRPLKFSLNAVPQNGLSACFLTPIRRNPLTVALAVPHQNSVRPKRNQLCSFCEMGSLPMPVSNSNVPSSSKI